MHYCKLAYWTVSKKKWNTKEDKDKSMVGALYIRSYAKRHLSAEATLSSEKMNSVTFTIALRLSEGIRQAGRQAGWWVGGRTGRQASNMTHCIFTNHVVSLSQVMFLKSYYGSSFGLKYSLIDTHDICIF